MEQVYRCEWAGPDQIYIDYHDNEWGQPLHDDNKLFEMLILEGMQAGLAWITVLKKREAFRAAFDNFDPPKVALYDDAKIEALMANTGIIRHRGKINAAIGNAKAFLEIQKNTAVSTDSSGPMSITHLSSTPHTAWRSCLHPPRCPIRSART